MYAHKGGSCLLRSHFAPLHVLLAVCGMTTASPDDVRLPLQAP
jgi:hypothetical protein